MNLHTLQPATGAIKSSKRVGRGQGSGKGGTSTRGHKGAKSRSGYKRKLGFEGGQMPLQRRLPAFGFKNPNRIAYKPINLSMLQTVIDKHAVTAIDDALLRQHGLISKNTRYKILSNGTLTTKVDVTAHAFSDKAKKMIEKLGGKTTTLQKYA